MNGERLAETADGLAETDRDYQRLSETGERLAETADGLAETDKDYQRLIETRRVW